MPFQALIVNIPGDGVASYVQGDIVEVKPDDWVWGKQEHPSTRTLAPTNKFVIITVTGLNPEQVQEVLETWETTTADGEPLIIQKRVARLDFSRLSASEQQQLATTGLLTLNINNINQLRNLMQRKDV
jgi:hypothetical protein